MRKYHPEYLFLVACVAIVVATVYDVILQYSAVPAVMRYVPPESTIYGFTSSLKSIWLASEKHVGPFFRRAVPAKESRSQKDARYISDGAQEIKKFLRDRGVQLAQVDDLPALGIDPESGAAFAVVKGATNGQFLAVLPILSKEKFLATVGKLSGTKVVSSKSPLKVGDRKYALYESEKFFIVFPDDSTALLASDKSVLPRSLLDSAANLAFFRSSDHANRRFAQLLGNQRNPEAWIKGSMDLGQIARNLRFVVAIDNDSLLIRTAFAPPTGQSQRLQNVVTQGSASLASMNAELSFGNMTAVLPESSFWRDFGALIKQFGGTDKSPLESLFPGVMDELEKARNAGRMNLAVSNESGAVPDVLLGVEMNEAEANDLVFRVQSKLRIDRDKRILDAARKQRAESGDGVATLWGLSPQALVAEKFLSDARDPLWTRYRQVNDATRVDPPLVPADFANATYERVEGGRVLRFVFPPMTDDDIRYRVSKESRDRVSEEDLKADRYRLCSVYWQGTLWFGNDASSVQRWLKRLQSPRVNADVADVSRIAESGRHTKAALFIHPRALLEQGMLHSDPRVNEWAQHLADLADYRALLMTISADQNEKELYASVTLLRY